MNNNKHDHQGNPADTSKPAQTLVAFAHGKESGPWGSKIQYLANIAKRYGAQVLSPDYSDLVDPEERVQRLLSLDFSEFDELILVGSSMGGYVSAVAAARLKPQGLFLLAPAIGMPGYAQYPALPEECQACVVHGWQDEVVSAEHSIRFCREAQVQLHLLNGDHRLTAVLPEIGNIFEHFLRTTLGSMSGTH